MLHFIWAIILLGIETVMKLISAWPSLDSQPFTQAHFSRPIYRTYWFEGWMLPNQYPTLFQPVRILQKLTLWRWLTTTIFDQEMARRYNSFMVLMVARCSPSRDHDTMCQDEKQGIAFMALQNRLHSIIQKFGEHPTQVKLHLAFQRDTFRIL